MLISTKNIKAQLLSQDPLYTQVFFDDFNGPNLDTSKWKTHWPWSNVNFPNTNRLHTCDGSAFGLGSDTVDIADTRSRTIGDTTNRKFLSQSGVTFQRLISKKENVYDAMPVYHRPGTDAWSIHQMACCGADTFRDGNNQLFCYYDSLVPFKFSTAMLWSHYKFKYGYFEMRYRLDNVGNHLYNAYGPNFWMFGGDSSCTYSELDFFEQNGLNWHMDANLYCRHKSPTGYTGPSDDTAQFQGHANPPNYYKPYHDQVNNQIGANGGNWFTVGCEWTPDYMDVYYNQNDTTRRFSKSAYPSDLNPMSTMTAMNMIIDIYMPAFQYCIPFVNGQTVQPFNYDIDYVKVYQINQAANCPSASGSFPNFTTNSYISKLYRDVTVGGGGSAILNSGSYHIAGQNFVELDAGFEVSGTATVIISTTTCQTDQSKIYNKTIYPYLPNQQVFSDLKTGKKGLPTN